MESEQPLAANVDEIERYFNKHVAAADSILSCEVSDYSRILDLKEPITEINAHTAFIQLSNLLSPECNIGVQYKRAQEAHNCKCY